RQFASPLIFLLDARATGRSRNVRERYSCVLRNFTENILAIDQLEPPTPQRLEIDTELSEVPLLVVTHVADHVGRIQRFAAYKTLLNPIHFTRRRNDEVTFRKIGERTVVEVRRVLVSQEGPERRDRPEKSERVCHVLAVRELGREIVIHNEFEQAQMVSMLE